MADFVIWREEYSVSNKSIDIQHQYLIAIINKVFTLVKAKSPSEGINRLLEDLKAYTKTHFEYEEKLMQLAGYPDIKSHQSLHRVMADRTAGMCKMQKSSATGIMPVHILDFLKEWWITLHLNLASGGFSHLRKNHRSKGRNRKGPDYV